jgi:hypothetical protein
MHWNIENTVFSLKLLPNTDSSSDPRYRKLKEAISQMRRAKTTKGETNGSKEYVPQDRDVANTA